jgi:hypothetical protein
VCRSDDCTCQALFERSTSTVVTQSVKQARAVETTGRDRQPQAKTTYAGRVPLCSVRGDAPKASMQSRNLSALVLHTMMQACTTDTFCTHACLHSDRPTDRMCESVWLCLTIHSHQRTCSQSRMGKYTATANHIKPCVDRCGGMEGELLLCAQGGHNASQELSVVHAPGRLPLTLHHVSVSQVLFGQARTKCTNSDMTR